MDKLLYICSSLLFTVIFVIVIIWGGGGASLVAQTVKHMPTMQETRVQSLGWEDPLEKEMAPHSSVLAWKIPWTEEPGRLQFRGSQSWTRLSNFTFTFTFYHEAYRILIPNQGSNLCCLQHKLRVLTTEQPGKSHDSFLHKTPQFLKLFKCFLLLQTEKSLG